MATAKPAIAAASDLEPVCGKVFLFSDLPLTVAAFAVFLSEELVLFESAIVLLFSLTGSTNTLTLTSTDVPSGKVTVTIPVYSPTELTSGTSFHVYLVPSGISSLFLMAVDGSGTTPGVV